MYNYFNKIFSKINYKKAIFIILIFSPLLFSAKLVVPYYQYEISGIFDNQNIGKLENNTLVIFGKKADSQNWYALHQFLINNTDKQDFPICLTDTNGNFLLRVTTQLGKLDSIKVAKIDIFQNYAFSNSIYVGKLDSTEIKNRFEYSNQSGCSCENTTSSELVVTGYYMTIKNQKIKIN